MRRKGELMVIGIIVGAIISLLATTISVNTITSSSGVLGSNSATDQFTELASEARNVCEQADFPPADDEDTAVESDPVDIDFGEIRSITGDSSGSVYTLKAEMDDGTSELEELERCNYNLVVGGGADSITYEEATTWTFTVTSERTDGTPSVDINAEPGEQ